MLKDLSKKLDNQNENLKNISKCFETVSFIIKNTQSQEILSDLKNVLKDLKPVLTNLEDEITVLENSLPTSENNISKEQTHENNTLLISEIKKKVVLPYTIDELQKQIEELRKSIEVKEQKIAEYKRKSQEKNNA